MQSGVAIHTAARRYCLERFTFWADRYADIVRRGRDRERDGYNYTLEALATFPRYQVLNAIRVELERIDPTGLVDLETARGRLVRAGETASDDFTRTPTGAFEQQATAEERAAFCSYVRGLSPSDLSAVQPLPLQRVLSSEESAAVRTQLQERWQITGGYWYPLAECSIPGVAAFDARAFEEGAPPAHLQDVLTRRGVRRVWELREYAPEYEQEVALFDPHYNGAEGYWSACALDWIVYASHEGSVTIGGWLLDEVKSLWAGWQDHLWTGVF